MSNLFKNIVRKADKSIKKSAKDIPRKVNRTVKLKSIKEMIPVIIINPLDSSRAHKKAKDKPYLGAHIFVKKKLHGIGYQHHGIYVGNSRVIHLMDDDKGVCEISLENFCAMGTNKHYGITHSPRQGSLEKVVKRANKLLDNQNIDYIWWKKNCQHFANYCRNGEWRL